MKIKGFTIVPDSIVQKYTAIGGLIYGKIVRYCEWSDMNICTASNARLAEELNLGESTIRKYKKLFEDDGLLKIVGKKGETDTVTIVEEMVIEMPTPLLDSEEVATKQLATPLLDSNKDTIKNNNKDFKRDALDFVVAYSGKTYSDFSEYPAVQEKLDLFMKHYPGIEIKGRGMLNNFVKQAEEDWEGFSLDDIDRMCKYCKSEKGWSVAQPKSIVSAYNMMGQVEEAEWQMV